MAEKVLQKIGGNSGLGTFEVVDVDGLVELRFNGVDTGGARTFAMDAPETATDTATLTAAQLINGLILGTPTAAATYTLPTGTLLDAALGNPPVGFAFEFVIVNLSTTATDVITVAAGTGITLIGRATIEENDADFTESEGRFFARKTAANTFTVYRVG